MPHDEEPRQRTREFWLRELSGVALLFWAVFLFMCLTSFSPADPSLNHALSRGEVQNLGGVIGAYMAGLLNDFFGSGSLVLPVGLGIMGLGFLSSRFALTWTRWLGFAIAAACVMVFFAALDLSLGDLNSGGMVGVLVFRASRSLLSPFGAGLLWFFVFLVGIQLFINLPWRRVITLLAGFFSRFIVRDEEDADFILENDAAPRATRLGQGPETHASPKGRSMAGRLWMGLAGKIGGRFFRREGTGTDVPGATGELDSIPADEAANDAVATDTGSRHPGKRPDRVRTAPIINLQENDIPFASLEDCGVPLDTSYAEQYASDVKGEAPEVVRRTRKPRIRARNGQKNALLRLLFPAGQEGEGGSRADGPCPQLGGEPSPGLESGALDAAFDEREALFGNGNQNRGFHDDPQGSGFPVNGIAGDDLFQLEEHGGRNTTVLPAGTSAARPDFSLELDDFDKAPGERRVVKQGSVQKPDDAGADLNDFSDLDGFDERDELDDAATPRAGAAGPTQRPGGDRGADPAMGPEGADERGFLLGGIGTGGRNGTNRTRTSETGSINFNDNPNTVRDASCGPDNFRDNLESDPFDGLNRESERPAFGTVASPLPSPLEGTTRGNTASSPASARPSLAGLNAGSPQCPDPADGFFVGDEYADEDGDEDGNEDAYDGYGTDPRVPEIVRGTPGLGKGRQERVSATDGLMFPPLELLDKPVAEEEVQDEELEDYAERLMGCLQDFGIQAELVRATPGPVVTTYMLRPAPGVSVRSFLRHTEDIARSLMAVSVFIQAPVPGTDTVGIVIPNRTRQVVNFRQIAEDKVFVESKAHLPLIIGKDTTGLPFVADLARMPHLLVAGATGQGKSVCLNAMLTSLLVRKTPNELKLLLVDPKRVEMGIYEHESHLIHPVVKEVEDAKNALLWAVQEMDQRYTRMSRLNTKNIEGYNARLASYNGRLPADIADLAPMAYIVIVIDELADLMLQARKDVEPCIIRLAQLARASGIHMIIATQRPSVDVVTGLIKANFPCRICFRVSARQDSMTTLGQAGAEKLLGNGDMFYNPNGGQLVRLHGPYLRDEEVQLVVDFWKKQVKPDYRVDFSSMGEEEEDEAQGSRGDMSGSDAMYREVIEFCREKGHVSISLLQRRFNIGFNKAARYMDQLDKDGLVGPSPGAGKPRPVLIR